MPPFCSETHLAPTVMNLRLEESDEDQDSLFGSPPPSPRPTGMPSPTLALPSMGSSGSRLSPSTAPATKNVGTIALPGSHPDSELPINPLALSLNHGIVQRPPAHIPPIVKSTTASTSTQRGRPAASTSQPPLLSSKPKPKKRSKPTTKVPTRTPSGPEFALPDPSAPPPSNFLRNQEKLLGTAGLVAGVKPATLTHKPSTSSKHVRGSTPSNPILVTDDDDAPVLGRRKASQSREPTQQPSINPNLLVAPTNEEIVSVLIAQKDIVPILQGVLKLVLGNVTGLNAALAPPPPPPPTGFERTPASGQPAKKRKLNRVPAGATDWDVPYPFEKGEGPDAYRQNWERERGKQLISQLMKLIKSAARKAATKKYLQQEQERRGSAGKKKQKGTSKENNQRKPYYKPEYGNTMSTPTSTPTETNSSAHPSNPIPSTSQPDGTLPDTQQTTLQGMMDLSLPSFDTADFGDLSNLSTPSELQDPTIFDPSSFDSLMNFFTTTFPTSFDGTAGTSVDSSTPTSHCSTPGPDDFTFSDLFSQPVLGDSNLDNLNLSTSATSELSAMLSTLLNQPQPSSSSSSMDSINSSFPAHIPAPEPVIDPSLLALSSSINLDTSTFMATSISLTTPPIAQAASPIPSTSSFSGNDPATPASANWDMSLPDVFMAGADGGSGGAGTSSSTANNGQGWDANANGADFGRLPDLTVTGSEVDEGTIPSARVDKGKGRAIEVDVDMPVDVEVMDVTSVSTIPAPMREAQEAVRALLESSTSSRASSNSTLLEKARATRKERKEDIIKRAKEKRQRLQEELNKVKMQLWETTIEQAGLMQLARQLESGVEVVEKEKGVS